ncbi:GroES-like protein [Coniophora puteana RWD-64-598 SS2]|uniref:GroES-like protein n=1 Tax=Coniophora puteana (strain RWD-64-598) TaxID=741705 RepID=A0A5M3MWA6_CONPW|nr:GroES-like protein [Coniophora puteana RWD-64-598 SS2]EIW83024.1 GroES-like protein [Coniophora puteana RWD-64-598 SS2]
MAKQQALFIETKQGPFVVDQRDIPTPGPGEVLIKEYATALNPVDWKIQEHVLWVQDYPAIVGHEGAGVVEAIGEGVTRFAKGDRVFHPALAGSDYASFQQYVLCPSSIIAKIPEKLSFEQAASITVGLSTSSVPLYQPPPLGLGYQPLWEGGRGKYQGLPILIIGGSTSVGQYAIQLVKLSGFHPIITTASLHNRKHLESLGASHVLDRKASLDTLAAEIKNITNIPLDVVFDTFASPETQKAGYDLLSPEGCLVRVQPQAFEPDEGSKKRILGVVGTVYENENREYGEKLFSNVTQMLVDGDIMPNDVEILSGGLHGVAAGLQMMKDGLVSAKKLVARPNE